MAMTTEDPHSHTRTDRYLLDEQYDFSLVLGGPIFQLFLKSHLAGEGLDLLLRRLLAITFLAWLPLLLLAIFARTAGTVGALSFLRDIEVNVRFLVALPILVAAELAVHTRIRPVVRAFVERRIVLPEDLPGFRKAIESAMRLRNSVALEAGLLLLVYTVGLWVWNGRPTLGVPTWYAMPGGNWRLTPAGFWYVFVSIPVFQFILLRWYVRLFIWYRFLWQVCRLNLHLVPTHPDRAAGLAFLGKTSHAFSPILFAQGAMLSGLVGSRVLYGGASLASFKVQIIGFLAFFVLALLGPLLMFTPRMAQAKRKGLAEYGLLAQQYVDSFQQKWIRRDPAPADDLLGTGDIQSLADLGNSYEIVREMRPVPFGLNDIYPLVAATAAPLLPLLLTVFSPDELFIRVLRVAF